MGGERRGFRMATTPPLAGVKVLDLTRLLPGGYCTLLLADLGAEVLKVEEPGRGDYIRWMPPLVGGVGAGHLALNRNKHSLTLNLKAEEGRRIFHRLAEGADVVVEGFRPGVAARLAIDYDRLEALNPRLVYCSISGYGQTGPYKDLVGHDVNYIGIGGVLSLTGPQNQPPAVPGVQIADVGGGGLMAAVGILAALLARGRTGRGDYVDVAMLDGVVSWLSIHAQAYFVEGRSPKRGNARLTGGYACYNVYETSDGKYLTIGALEEHFWRNLCLKLGREDFVKDQFTPGERQREMIAHLRKVFREKSRDEWFNALRDAEVCCGPVNELDEVFRDPQVLHRSMVRELDHPTLGRIKEVGTPLKLSGVSAVAERPPQPSAKTPTRF